MRYRQALKLLDLVEPFTIHDIKKKYREKALQYHPDKNEEGEEMFREIKDAHDFLLEYKTRFSSKDDMFYNNSSGFYTFCNVYQQHLPAEWKFTIDTMVQKGKSWMFQYIREYMDSSSKQHSCYTLYPSLDDMIHHNIHKMGNYCVPLWHREVHFEDKVFYIVPKMPSCVEIDEMNNIYISIERNIQDVLKDNGITFQVSKSSPSFFIPTTSLQIKNEQQITLENIGISLIQTQDIYDISKKANIIVHIILK